MTPEQKEWIDTASYHQLLKHWRFAPCGDPMFIGEAGNYYSEVIMERRQHIGPEEHTRISKLIDEEHRRR
jgi:hypothetical protein